MHWSALLLCVCTQALRPLTPPRQRGQPLRATQYDAVVVGTGVGGLCTAALLARYDRRVLLVEAHDVVGGCAHSFDRGGYTCDSGPSLWAGCAQPSTSDFGSATSAEPRSGQGHPKRSVSASDPQNSSDHGASSERRPRRCQAGAAHACGAERPRGRADAGGRGRRPRRREVGADAAGTPAPRGRDAAAARPGTHRPVRAQY